MSQEKVPLLISLSSVKADNGLFLCFIDRPESLSAFFALSVLRRMVPVGPPPLIQEIFLADPLAPLGEGVLSSSFGEALPVPREYGPVIFGILASFEFAPSSLEGEMQVLSRRFVREPKEMISLYLSYVEAELLFKNCDEPNDRRKRDKI